MPVRHAPLLGLALPALLVACDKQVISEHVKPVMVQGGGTPSQDLDGSVVVDEPRDGGVGDGDDDGGEISTIVDDVDGEFSKRNLIEAAGKCAMATYRAFEQRAKRLDQVTAAWLADPTDEKAGEARAAFRAAMDMFQRAELFRFGPMTATNEPGGQGYREEIYAFPHANLCKVDQQIVDQTYQRDFASSVATGRGLSALEYLEYYVGSQNTCSPAITINANGTWAQLSADELKKRRMEYAGAAAHDIAERASALVHAFGPDGENFQAKELNRAGQGSTIYTSEQAALNAISHGMFYIDIEVKDHKLALPLGISPDCLNTTCPESVESRFARISTPNIATNLRAFRAVFQGCGSESKGLGFDDWLTAVGREDLANAMLEALDGAEAAVAALDPPIEQAIQDDPAKVQVVYDAVKKLTDILKTEFMTVLDLGLPRTAEGDND